MADKEYVQAQVNGAVSSVGSDTHGEITTSAEQGKVSGTITIPATVTLVDQDYEKLVNKPTINGVEITKNTTLAELGFTYDQSKLSVKYAASAGNGVDYVTRVGTGINIILKDGTSVSFEQQDTTYDRATQTKDGLMAAEDKQELAKLREDYNALKQRFEEFIEKAIIAEG